MLNPDVKKQIDDVVGRIEGQESVRTRGRSRYLRKALTKIMNMSPAEFKDYEPKNGWEEAMAHQRRMMLKENGSSTTAIKAATELMGEKFDSKEKAEESPAVQGPVGIQLAN
ncbi:MAG TPA: hypothetical protein VGS27_21300 [Candidatus Sulfotelmatobacter sp.]|nr:hypothetical protein [Candidatus Sulfotelmatobacter sp.]